MGASSSSGITCPHCRCIGAEPSRENAHNCSRCHGALPATQSVSNSLRAPFGGSNGAASNLLPSAPELLCVHLAPFQDSLDANLPEEMKEDELINYLRDRIVIPYFETNPELVIENGIAMQLHGIDFRIISCSPPGGKPSRRTIYSLTDETGGLRRLHTRPLSRIHVLPTKAASEEVPANMADIMTQALLTDPPRHVTIGEVFVHSTLQFRVMACEPLDGYCEGGSTEFHWNGEAVPDLTRVKILPIYESLPNHQKHLPPSEIRELYLRQHMSGRYLHVRKETELTINGVRFSVEESEPDEGIITFRTLIDNDGPPLRSEALELRQIDRDEEMARQLQQQENVVQPQISGRGGLPNDRRMMFEELAQRGEFLALIEQLRNMQRQTRAMSSSALDRLPTAEYHVSEETPGDTEDDFEVDDQRSCRICLMEYEEGDVIRFLPCLHKYHRQCIDKWLSEMSRKCPICKTDIARAMGGQ